MQAPDWGFWAKRRKATVWQCLALSQDIEPRDLGMDHFLALRSVESKFPWLSDKDPDWLKELCRRLRGLLKDLRREDCTVSLPEDHAPSADTLIHIRQFVAWLQEQKWDTPDALFDMRGAARAASDTEAAAEPAPEPEEDAHNQGLVLYCLLMKAGIDPQADDAGEQTSELLRKHRAALSPQALRPVLDRAAAAADNASDTTPLGKAALKSQRTVMRAVLKSLALKPGDGAAAKRVKRMLSGRKRSLPDGAVEAVLDHCV